MTPSHPHGHLCSPPPPPPPVCRPGISSKRLPRNVEDFGYGLRVTHSEPFFVLSLVGLEGCDLSVCLRMDGSVVIQPMKTVGSTAD